MRQSSQHINNYPSLQPDYHRSYQSEGDGELGFSRKKTGGAKKGYQHFDSFHKKAGDHYEFEKQDSYGQDEAAKAGGTGHHHHHADHDGEYSHRHEKKGDLRAPLIVRRPLKFVRRLFRWFG